MTRAPLAYVVAPGPTPGTCKARCPFCARRHVHPSPRHDHTPAQPPCSPHAHYRLVWFWRPDTPEGAA